MKRREESYKQLNMLALPAVLLLTAQTGLSKILSAACAERERCSMSNEQTPGSTQGCRELTGSEIEVLSHIFDTILRSGRAPTLEELHSSLGKSITETADVVNELEEKDLLVRSKQTEEIVAIYPFSLTPTGHRVFIENGKTLFAMCAADALGIPNMFNRNVRITSHCEGCEEKITIEIEDGKIVSKSHPDILIWSPKRQEKPAAEKCCPLVNFFCSDEHLREWEAKNPQLAESGHSRPLEQEYPCIQECWERYGEAMRLRQTNRRT